ncbi:FAD-binding oxidoreductase [Aureimonas populi]|uniref:FAD-binding oxidoreductase n=1 Tax=Aureimonas populi TaxID=1701758 RepID=A0ABW5CL16_9HYPH|nr:FAD-binding oxidoreductase [Aureimonas populi]
MTVENFLTALRAAVGAGNVWTDLSDLAPLLQDWRGDVKGEALAAVFPQSCEEVSAVLRIAAEAKRPIVPQGGNTGLSYGATARDAATGIVLGLRRMRMVREIDRASNIVTVEAGLTLAELHEEVARVERQMPLRLGSEGTAQIGGLVSTNAGGTGALRYGPMRDLVAGVEVVLPDGRIFSDLAGLKKNNTGYDLKHLFIGAEGTLGVVTAAALRLHPLVRSSASAWLAFDALPTAVEILMRLQERFDSAVQAVELLNADQVAFALQHVPRTRLPFDQVPAWSLMIELGSSDPASDLKGALEEWLITLVEDDLVSDGFLSQSVAQAEDIWHVRHSVSEANRIAGHSLSHDVAVRPSRVPELIERAGEAVRTIHPEARILIVSHLGDGNVHFIAHFDHAAWASFEDPERITGEVMDRVHDVTASLGGTFSAEHGIGRKLVRSLAERTAPERLSLMREVKRMLDPENRMNPGALFSAEAKSTDPLA